MGRHAGDRIVTGCLLAITFGTGVVDALSWISLSGVFTANMSGNVLLVGIGAVGAQGADWFPALFALCWFLLGAGIVGRWMHRDGSEWTIRTTIVFAAVPVVLLLVAGFAVVWPPDGLGPATFTAEAALALAMGAQGAAAVRLAVPGLITVAVTSATVGVGVALFLGGAARGTGVLPRLCAIVLLAAGAFTGAMLAPLGVPPALLVAAAVAAAAALVGDRFARPRS